MSASHHPQGRRHDDGVNPTVRSHEMTRKRASMEVYAREETPFACLHGCVWHPKDATAVAFGGGGRTCVYSLRGGRLERRFEATCGRAGLRASCFLDESVLAFAAEDGSLRSMDCNVEDRGSFEVIGAHRGTVLALSNAGSTTIVTGGEDGAIRLWDTRNKAIRDVQTLNQTCKNACWCLEATKTHQVLAGFADGRVSLYDLRRGEEQEKLEVCRKYLPDGICGISSTTDETFVAATLRTMIWSGTWREEKDEECRAYRVRDDECTIWTCSPSPHRSNALAVGDGRGAMHLCRYQIDERAPVVEKVVSVNIATQPVISAEWHSEQPGVLLCTSMDDRVHVLLCVDTKGIGA